MFVCFLPFYCRNQIELDSKSKTPQQNVISEIQTASKLVKQLETVEQQYESIINKLPSDCSQIEQNSTGLFMIAPGGQQHPILANCVNQWTTIQRRHDGSVDFNRSWDEYSQGKESIGKINKIMRFHVIFRISGCCVFVAFSVTPPKIPHEYERKMKSITNNQWIVCDWFPPLSLSLILI